MPVELDLTGVGLFSSAAVRVVRAIARIARDASWRLTLRAPEGGVTRHILGISGLASLVDTAEIRDVVGEIPTRVPSGETHDQQRRARAGVVPAAVTALRRKPASSDERAACTVGGPATVRCQ